MIGKASIEDDTDETEVNGKRLEGFDEEMNIITRDGKFTLDEIEWIRVEEYSGGRDYNGMDLMYIYLPVKDGKIDLDSVQFDIYYDPESDNCIEDVFYRDCPKSLAESRRMRWRRI